MGQKREQVITDVFDELKRAEKQHPGWPDNPFEQLAIIGEEFGELQQAVLQAKWEKGSEERIKEEAVQLTAMSLRFLLNLTSDSGVYAACPNCHAKVQEYKGEGAAEVQVFYECESFFSDNSFFKSFICEKNQQRQREKVIEN